MLLCPECKRTQGKGKYCLDCGCVLKEESRKKCLFKVVETSRSTDTLKSDIRRWLTRIGVLNPDIQIKMVCGSASITYVLDGQEYTFSSEHQSDFKHNLAAVEMFLHHRVLSIERGIETASQAFAGYVALEYQGSWFDSFSSKEGAEKEYKRLCKVYHPDAGGDKEVFCRIQNAYKQLPGGMK